MTVVQDGSDVRNNGFSQAPVLSAPPEPRIMGNYVAYSRNERGRRFVGSIESAAKRSDIYFHRACDRGFVCDWDTQKEVLDTALETAGLIGHALGATTAADTALLVTEPPHNPHVLRRVMCELVFEEYGFGSAMLALPQWCALQGHRIRFPESPLARSPAALVVDVGYSATNVVPFFDSSPLNFATRRTEVGGKLLTNFLKELVSYRHWNVAGETFLMNHVKEKLCFVPDDLRRVLAECQVGKHGVDYVLPDYVSTATGFVKGSAEADAHEAALKAGVEEGVASTPFDEQIMHLSTERAVVAEALFQPALLGLPDAGGVAQAVTQATSACIADMHAPLVANILLTGGSARMNGFADRLQAETRSRFPDTVPVNVFECEGDFRTAAWRGAAAFAAHKPVGSGPASPGCSDTFLRMSVSKAAYEEYGVEQCLLQFGW